MTEPHYITVHGVASLLGVSRRRAYQLVQQDDFPKPEPVDTGDTRPLLLFERKRVMRWIEETR